MRDYVVAIIILTSFPIALVRPFYGLLVYTWVSYMNPHLLAWSFVRTMPVAKITALGTILGVLLNRSADLRPLRKRENVLMVLLFMTFTFTTFFAIHQERAWPEWQEVSKIIVMALLTSTMITDPGKLRYFILLVALSLGFYGVKGGIFSLRTGGEKTVYGPGTDVGSMIAANNALGLALNMCLPLCWFLARNEQKLWLKRMLQLSFLLAIPAIMFTYSRASAIALGVVLLTLVLKARRRLFVIGVVILLVILYSLNILSASFLPEKWLNRQESTVDYEGDRSALSRLDEWKFCWRLALDRPITGGGFEFYSPETYAKYSPEFLETYGKTWNSHSIYFGMLAAHGFPGLFGFLAMIGSTVVSLQRSKRLAQGHPDLFWIADYCEMLQISFLAFLVNGAFNNMEYFDLVYHWIGVSASISVVARDRLDGMVIHEVEQSDLAVPAERVTVWSGLGNPESGRHTPAS